MKNKILMFALMCALMVSVVPLHHTLKAYATTEEEFVDISHIVEELGSFDAPSDFYKYPYQTIYLDEYNWYQYICCDKPLYVLTEGSFRTENNDTSLYYWYYLQDGVWKFWKQGYDIVRLGYDSIYCSTYDIYDVNGNVVYKNDVEYDFPKWCEDSGLNCQASSNESTSVIPYSYNDYWHIVRRTNKGKYLLTTIGNSVSIDSPEDYTIMISEDYSKLKVWNLYSLDDVNGYKLNVRQYIYDTDGWKLQDYSTYDSRDSDDFIIDLGTGSGLDSTKVLSYTNKDIYSENGLDLLVSASEKYGDIILEIPDKPINPEMPTEIPKPTYIPVIDLSNLDISLKLEDISINGFKYNGIEYKWGNIKNYIDSKDLEDYAVFYNDYNRQLVFVWAFDDLMVQGKLKKSGLRYYEYYFEFITSANNTSVAPYAIIKFQINTDGTLTEIENVLTDTYSNNHQFEFAWTNADYKPRIDDYSTFDNYITYVLNNNIVVSNCDIYDNTGVLLKTSISHDNSKIQIENIPDTEFGILKHFIYEKLPIIGTVEVFIAKFKSVLNSMKDTNKAPEIIMNVKDFYGYSGQLNVLDLSWYEPYREYVKAIISALLIVPFILWVYRKGLPDAIGGI